MLNRPNDERSNECYAVFYKTTEPGSVSLQIVIQRQRRYMLCWKTKLKTLLPSIFFVLCYENALHLLSQR